MHDYKLQKRIRNLQILSIHKFSSATFMYLFIRVLNTDLEIVPSNPFLTFLPQS